MGRNMRAEVSLSCPLLAFEFGFRSEPEFVASTVRPTRKVPQLIGLFADHLFSRVHVCFVSSFNHEADGARGTASRLCECTLSALYPCPSRLLLAFLGARRMTRVTAA